MNGALKRVGLALVGFGAIGGLSGAMFAEPAPAQTQTNPNQALPGLGSSDQGSGSFGSAEGLDMYDLFHRLQMGAMPSLSEFNQEQQRTINSAASDFRARQLERLRQQNLQNQSTPVDPVSPLPSAQPSINSMPQ